jgi:hypothetical protein
MSVAIVPTCSHTLARWMRRASPSLPHTLTHSRDGWDKLRHRSHTLSHTREMDATSVATVPTRSHILARWMGRASPSFHTLSHTREMNGMSVAIVPTRSHTLARWMDERRHRSHTLSNTREMDGRVSSLFPHALKHSQDGCGHSHRSGKVPYFFHPSVDLFYSHTLAHTREINRFRTL